VVLGGADCSVLVDCSAFTSDALELGWLPAALVSGVVLGVVDWLLAALVSGVVLAGV